MNIRSSSLSGMIVVVMVAFAINRMTDVDLEIARWFYAPADGGFYLRSDWLWATVFHDGAKLAAILLWSLMCLWLPWMKVTEVTARRTVDRPLRAFLAFTVVVAIVSAAATAWIKSRSAHSCPWLLAPFGGPFQYFRLLEAVPPNAGPGRCLPSGHASVGFMWIAAIYAARRWRPSIATIVTLVVLGFGSFVSAVQVVRGEHFLSHVLLTAALCWAVACVADTACGLLSSERASMPIRNSREH